MMQIMFMYTGTELSMKNQSSWSKKKSTIYHWKYTKKRMLNKKIGLAVLWKLIELQVHVQGWALYLAFDFQIK